MNNPVWVVNDVQAKTDYTLLITFVNGEKRIYNARPLLNKAIYSKLRNLPYFMSAKALCGTVVWDDDIDIAPEHLYEHSKSVRDIVSS